MKRKAITTLSDADIRLAARRLAVNYCVRVSDAEHYLRLGLSEDTIATCAALARSQGQPAYVVCSMALSMQRTKERGDDVATYNDLGGPIEQFAGAAAHVGTVRRSRRLSCLGAL